MKWKHFVFRTLGNPSVLFYVFLSVLLVPNVLLSITEPMGWMGRLCNVLLPLSVYWGLLCVSRKTGRTFLWLLPLTFLAAFQIVLLYLFRRSIIAVDMFLNLVTTNSDEALELLGKLMPAIILVVVLYVPALVMAGVSAVRRQQLPQTFMTVARRRFRYLLVTGIGCWIGAVLFEERYDTLSDLYPLNVCYNIGLAVERTALTENYTTSSQYFSYGASSLHPADRREVYVLVVGETSRACNWALQGYVRPTNPQLAQMDGCNYFPLTLSESNTTHKSVPMLLSPVSAIDYDSIYYRKGVLTAFREAGFHTAYFSNQRYNHSFIEFFGKEADRCRFLREEGKNSTRNPSDGELLQMVAEELKQQHTKQFIVLHQYGSHFNYRERYPETAVCFLPDSPTDAEPSNRPTLLNAYDNTIRYTDAFLADLIRMLRQEQIPAVLLYTSDHGEDIFDDDRRRFLHASPVPTYYQVHVPFLVWMSEEYRTAYPVQAAAVSANRENPVSSSASFFHSMLHLAGIQTRYRDDSLSVASSSYSCRPRVYLDDRNVAVPFSEMDWEEEDWNAFRRYRIAE